VLRPGADVEGRSDGVKGPRSGRVAATADREGGGLLARDLGAAKKRKM
jgi:hypothetical protein